MQHVLTDCCYRQIISNNADPNSIFWDFGNEKHRQKLLNNDPHDCWIFDVTLTVSSLTGGCTSTEIVKQLKLLVLLVIAATSPFQMTVHVWMLTL